MLRSSNTVDPVDNLAVRPFDLDRIKLTKTARVPVALEPLLGDEAACYLADPVGTLLKSDAELDSLDEVPKPYSDPLLHQPKVYKGLVAMLYKAQLLTFCTIRRATVGIFTVSKKLDENGIEWLRLIFDCRQVNWMSRKPPKSFLATPGAMANIDLSPESLGATGEVQTDRPFSGCFSAVDLVDAF